MPVMAINGSPRQEKSSTYHILAPLFWLPLNDPAKQDESLQDLTGEGSFPKPFLRGGGPGCRITSKSV